MELPYLGKHLVESTPVPWRFPISCWGAGSTHLACGRCAQVTPGLPSSVPSSAPCLQPLSAPVQGEREEVCGARCHSPSGLQPRPWLPCPRHPSLASATGNLCHTGGQPAQQDEWVDEHPGTVRVPFCLCRPGWRVSPGQSQACLPQQKPLSGGALGVTPSGSPVFPAGQGVSWGHPSHRKD